jgi:acetamidase/formamidase
LDASNGQITPTTKISSLHTFDASLADPAFGPVYISGAEPGDVLQIDILELQTADWGWTAVVPYFGLLADEFSEPVLKIWKIDRDGRYIWLKDGVRVRKRPFLGIMGVAPGDQDVEREGDSSCSGGLSMIPPRDIGGNIDCRSLTVGSTLYLPVRAHGALFSCGDGHAAQGDGEVCGTAIETPMRATLRLTVLKNQPWVTAPQFQTPPASLPNRARNNNVAADNEEDKGEYATTGVDASLVEATKKATRNMISWLVHTKGLTREEAYILASVAGNLRLVEVVDMPNYVVAMAMPLSCFV